jgi:dipeptidyl aminopeptidase/acylaminoacyl peptidase
MPAKTVLRDRDGKLIVTVEAGDASRVPRFWRWPQTDSMTAADGKTEISGLVFKPSDYDPTQKYPVIDYIYGGPQIAYKLYMWGVSTFRYWPTTTNPSR